MSRSVQSISCGFIRICFLIKLAFGVALLGRQKIDFDGRRNGVQNIRVIVIVEIRVVEKIVDFTVEYPKLIVAIGCYVASGAPIAGVN